MSGYNHYNIYKSYGANGSPQYLNASKRNSNFRIFLSHRQLDNEVAKIIAQLLKKSGIDYYFDGEDGPLQISTQNGDAKAVLTSVELGLSWSTHLLGIMSKNTQASWWVPFEIGQARKLGLGLGHIILDNLVELPEYMCISDNLGSLDQLNLWIRNNSPSHEFRFKSSSDNLMIPGFSKHGTRKHLNYIQR